VAVSSCSSVGRSPCGPACAPTAPIARTALVGEPPPENEPVAEHGAWCRAIGTAAARCPATGVSALPPRAGSNGLSSRAGGRSRRRSGDRSPSRLLARARRGLGFAIARIRDSSRQFVVGLVLARPRAGLRFALVFEGVRCRRRSARTECDRSFVAAVGRRTRARACTRWSPICTRLRGSQMPSSVGTNPCDRRSRWS